MKESFKSHTMVMTAIGGIFYKNYLKAKYPAFCVKDQKSYWYIFTYLNCVQCTSYTKGKYMNLTLRVNNFEIKLTKYVYRAYVNNIESDAFTKHLIYKF